MTDDSSGPVGGTDHTSAFDRVYSVASTVSEPRSAVAIAEAAGVDEGTARNHLARLVDLTVLLTTEQDGTTHYAPDPLHERLQGIRDVLDHHDRDDLRELQIELASRITRLRDEYGVDSPTGLRELAADTDTASQTRTIQQAANEWEEVAQQLSIIEDAMKLATPTDTG